MLTLDMRKRDLGRRDPAPVVGGGLGLAPEPRSHNLFGWDLQDRAHWALRRPMLLSWRHDAIAAIDLDNAGDKN